MKEHLMALVLNVMSVLAMIWNLIVVVLLGVYHGAVDAGLINPRDLPSDEEYDKQVEEELKEWFKDDDEDK